MTIADILVETERLGVSLRATPDGELLAKPIKAVPPDLRSAMQERKAELVRYLRAKDIAKETEVQGHDLTDHLCEHAPHLLNEPKAKCPTPAESIIGTCARYGIALRLSDDGVLVVGRSDMQGKGPALWPELVTAIEAHLAAVTALVASGWSLRADVENVA